MLKKVFENTKEVFRKYEHLMFYPFPLLKNEKTNSGLTKLVLKFANAESLKVVQHDSHYTTISDGESTLRFWSANKWHAYCSQGQYTKHGKVITWKDGMPSRYAIRKLGKAVRVKFD